MELSVFFFGVKISWTNHAELLTVGFGADKVFPHISTRVVVPRFITVIIVSNRHAVLGGVSVRLAFTPVCESVI